VAGVTLGLLILGIIAALGLSALVMNSPALYQLLRWGGVFYLLWLAWDDWHDAAAKPDRKVAPESNIKFFGRGLITNLLNPKAGIFYIAVLPNFVDATHSIVSQTLFLSVIFVFIATTIHTTIVMLAGAALPLLENTQQRLLLRRASSLALAAVAVWLAWSTRR
jgi:threonine/homoserine/homoserine lactone efflux protein